MGQLVKTAPNIAQKITAYRRIVGFRNILVHGYASVDDKLVWGIVETDVPTLLAEVDGLLDQ